MEVDPLIVVAAATAAVGVATLFVCLRSAPSSQISASSATAASEANAGTKVSKSSSGSKGKKKSKSKKSKSSGSSAMVQSSGDEAALPNIKTPSVSVASTQVIEFPAADVNDAEDDDDDDDNFSDPVTISQASKTKTVTKVPSASTAVVEKPKAKPAAKKLATEEDSAPPGLSLAVAPKKPETFSAPAMPPSSYDGWAIVEDKRKVKGKKEAEDVEVAEAAPEAAVSAPAAVTVDEEIASPVVSGPVIETTTGSIKVESKKLGLLIGPKGVTKIGLQTATGTDILMPKVERDHVGEVEILVTGPAEGVAKAIRAIDEMCTKGYCNLLAAEDFHEGYASVNPRYLPDIIGKGGLCIKAISAHTGVKINTPSGYTRTNEKGETVLPSKVKISLAGSRDKVTEARQLILDLCRYYHTPVTHPGITHVEMDIPSSYFNYIIGAKGSEIKHIQSNYRVSVHVPNADSMNPNVLIVGPPENVNQAEKHITKLMEKADTASAERAAAKAAGIALGERAKAKDAAQSAGTSAKQKTLGGGGGDPNARPPGANKEEPEAEWVGDFAPRSSSMQIDLSASLPASAKFRATPAVAPVPIASDVGPTPGGETAPASDSEEQAAGVAATDGSTRPTWGGMGALGIIH